MEMAYQPSPALDLTGIASCGIGKSRPSGRAIYQEESNMKAIGYVTQTLGIKVSEFAPFWKGMNEAEQTEFMNAGRADAAASGVALEDAELV